MMDRDDGDAVFQERFEHRLQFGFEHGEVAINNGIIVRSGESGPGVHAHFLSDLTTTFHLHGPSKDGFEHTVLRFAFDAEQSGEGLCVEGTGGGKLFARKRAYWLRSCGAHLFYLIEGRANTAGEFVGRTFAANMHEVDFWFVEKEVV